MAISAKTKQVREEWKKPLDEARVIIANNQVKEVEVSRDINVIVEEVRSDTRNVLNTIEWLNVISMLVSMVGLKRLPR